jgi:hypothetical protein
MGTEIYKVEPRKMPRYSRVLYHQKGTRTQFLRQIFFTQEGFPALALKARTPVIDIAAATLLDMLLRRQGAATMATGHQPSIGKRMLLLSRLMQALERGLCGIKEFSGDKRFVYPSIHLPVPAEISIVDGILQYFFEAPRREGLSGLAVGDAPFVRPCRQLFE